MWCTHFFFEINWLAELRRLTFLLVLPKSKFKPHTTFSQRIWQIIWLPAMGDCLFN